MPFSYIIKVEDEYIAISIAEPTANIYWHTVKSKARAMNMSKDFAESILPNVQEYFPSARIIGVDYDQN